MLFAESPLGSLFFYRSTEVQSEIAMPANFKKLHPKSLITTFILLFMAMGACREAPEKKNEVKAYYDLKGFIENQIVYLNESKPKVEKTLNLNGKKEVQSEAAIDWKKELELFAQADINKPAYRNSYTIIKSDSAVYEYKIKAGENLPVQFLHIEVDSATQQPLLVKAIVRSENKIYQSERQIELTCKRRNNLFEISSYSIDGYQKLLLTEQKSYNIRAKIGL